MPKIARQYDIYLPIRYNDGRVIPETLFFQVEYELTENRQESSRIHVRVSHPENRGVGCLVFSFSFFFHGYLITPTLSRSFSSCTPERNEEQQIWSAKS